MSRGITSENWTEAFSPGVVEATVREARLLGKTAVFIFKTPIPVIYSDNQEPEATDVYATIIEEVVPPNAKKCVKSVSKVGNKRKRTIGSLDVTEE